MKSHIESVTKAMWSDYQPDVLLMQPIIKLNNKEATLSVMRYQIQDNTSVLIHAPVKIKLNLSALRKRAQTN
jgi:hypothetical protein